MKTLNSNRNGKVVKTSTVGYSVAKVVKNTVAFLAKLGFEFSGEVDKAQTGSTYFILSKNGFDFNFRVSNHTKRFNGCDDATVELSFHNNGKYDYTISQLNIVDFASRDFVIDFLSKLDFEDKSSRVLWAA